MVETKNLDKIINVEKMKKFIRGTLLGKYRGLKMKINIKKITVNINVNFKYL